MADLIPFPSKKEIKDIQNRLYKVEKGLIDSINSKSEVDDIKKRLYQIENSLLGLIPVIDIAYEYEARLVKLEKEKNMTAALLDKTEDCLLEGEELHRTRIELCKLAIQEYLKFIENIKRIPHHPEMMKNAVQYFSDGSLWMKEAILTAQIKINKEIHDGQGKDEESESESAKGEEGEDA